MLDQRRIRSIGILIASTFLISILAPASHGQRHPRLKAPKALLDAIDQEDRDCVVQSGLDKSVTVRPIKLAADRSQQLLIRGSGLCLCGAQNCGFWIYRKIGNKYELLLKGIGATRVSAGQKSAKGYRDVISQSHASAMETILRTYRYDGSQYHLQRCVNRAYYDDNGKATKRPNLRPCAEETRPETYVSVPTSIRERELTTIDNQQLRLSDYSDRITVITLVASWCAPCLQLIPELDKIGREDEKGVQVIGLVTRENDPQIESVRRSTSILNVRFPVVWENIGFSESLSKLVNTPRVLPQTFVIDREGHIRKHFSGYSRANTIPLLREALNQIRREKVTQPTGTP
ncbi:MAG TPA: TlpA disulfide reductase family protein [Pyrinomonadaceae bacterium]|nr:TlpA disulfide reductase family protein [Pyrinomonadaceae bacterium]